MAISCRILALLFACLFIGCMTNSTEEIPNTIHDPEPVLVRPDDDVIPAEKVEKDYGEERIFNGEAVKTGTYPFMVSLQIFPNDTKPGRRFCSGSIVDKYWVITAAHCCTNTYDTQVYVVGGSALVNRYKRPAQINPVNDFIKHPNYDPTEDFNDICLMKLQDPFVWTTTCRPIDLPNEGHNVEKLKSGTVMGWGLTHPTDRTQITQVLMQTEVTTIPLKDCAKSYNVTTNQFCCMEKKAGSCLGDSGGPFIQFVNGKPVLAGIISYGSPRCGSKPGVYTRVNKFLGWIDSHVNPKKVRKNWWNFFTSNSTDKTSEIEINNSIID